MRHEECLLIGMCDAMTCRCAKRCWVKLASPPGPPPPAGSNLRRGSLAVTEPSRQAAIVFGMDDAITQLIGQTLDDARSAGLDYITETELAVRTVRAAYPDITAPDALAWVKVVRTMR